MRSDHDQSLITSLRRLLAKEIAERRYLRAENQRLRGEVAALRRCSGGVAYSARKSLESVNTSLARASSMLTRLEVLRTPRAIGKGADLRNATARAALRAANNFVDEFGTTSPVGTNWDEMAYAVDSSKIKLDKKLYLLTLHREIARLQR